MKSPLTMRLSIAAPLGPDDERVLDRLMQQSFDVPRKTDVIREGDEPKHVHLIVEGLACRYKLVEGGRRQILSLLLPGDFCDLHVALLPEMDHSIAALSPCKMVRISLDTVDGLITHRPRIARALWWATLVDEAILRENIAGLGQRETDRQMAHLFCELHTRLSVVGLVREDGFELLVTQEELGDMLGVTTVHANRTLMDLRVKDLVSFERGRVAIIDIDRLKSFAGFRANYLHLSGIKRAGVRKPDRESAIFLAAMAEGREPSGVHKVLVPVAAQTETPRGMRAKFMASSMNLEGKRVLVVEDEYFAADEMAAAVCEAGAQVVGPVASVEEALRLIRKGAEIDAAILDINLGGQMVFPVASALTEHRIPIVFVTGYDDWMMPPRYGDVPVFRKPADPAAVVRTLFEH